MLFGSGMFLRDTQQTGTTAKSSGISFDYWLGVHGSGVFLFIFVAAGTRPTQQLPLVTAVLLAGLTQTFLTLTLAVLFHCPGQHPGQIPRLWEAWLTCGYFFLHFPEGELAQINTDLNSFKQKVFSRQERFCEIKVEFYQNTVYLDVGFCLCSPFPTWFCDQAVWHGRTFFPTA